jgi:hypothetical protein
LNTFIHPFNPAIIELQKMKFSAVQFKKSLYNKKPSDGGTTGLDSLPSKGRGEPFERVS